MHRFAATNLLYFDSVFERGSPLMKNPLESLHMTVILGVVLTVIMVLVALGIGSA